MSRFLAALFCLALGLGGCALPRMVVLQDPLTPREHLELGLAYEKQGQYPLAAQEYQAAAKELPGAYLYLGNAYFYLGRDGEAESAYRQALEAEPKNPRAYNNLAWLLCARGEELEEAEFLARRALILAPAGEKDAYGDTLERVRRARRDGKPACERPADASPAPPASEKPPQP